MLSTTKLTKYNLGGNLHTLREGRDVVLQNAETTDHKRKISLNYMSVFHTTKDQ